MSCHCFCQRLSRCGTTATALPAGGASAGGRTPSGGARVADTVGFCGSTAATTCAPRRRLIYAASARAPHLPPPPAPRARRLALRARPGALTRSVPAAAANVATYEEASVLTAHCTTPRRTAQCRRSRQGMGAGRTSCLTTSANARTLAAKPGPRASPPPAPPLALPPAPRASLSGPGPAAPSPPAASLAAPEPPACEPAPAAPCWPGAPAPGPPGAPGEPAGAHAQRSGLSRQRHTHIHAPACQGAQLHTCKPTTPQHTRLLRQTRRHPGTRQP